MTSESWTKWLDLQVGKKCKDHGTTIRDGKYGNWCGAKDKYGKWCGGVTETPPDFRQVPAWLKGTFAEKQQIEKLFLEEYDRKNSSDNRQ